MWSGAAYIMIGFPLSDVLTAKQFMDSKHTEARHKDGGRRWEPKTFRSDKGLLE